MLTDQEWGKFRRDGVVSCGLCPPRLGQVMVYGKRASGTRYLTTLIAGLYGL